MAELYHYGTKHHSGRYPYGSGDRPYQDLELKKGTKLNSVVGYNENEMGMLAAVGAKAGSKAYLNRGRWTYLYDPKNEHDSKIYKGPFALYLAMYRGKNFVAEYQYELMKDLKMPSKEERVNEFKNLYNDKKYKKTVIKDLAKTREGLVRDKIGSDEEQARYKAFNPKNISSEEDFKTAYEIFNHAMEWVHAYESTKEYAKRMESKYDAMIDDNNRDKYNEAQNPVIIFKANQVLKECGDMKMLTIDEVMKNEKEIAEELAKKGKVVKL